MSCVSPLNKHVGTEKFMKLWLKSECHDNLQASFPLGMIREGGVSAK